MLKLAWTREESGNTGESLLGLMGKPPTRSSLKITEWYAHLMNDHDQIKAVIETYFLGQSTGDAIHMRAAFLPTSRIEGIRQEKFTSWTLEEYCAMFDGQPAANEAERRRSLDRIEIVAPTVATAVATLVHGATTFTDCFALLKIDGAWRIADKVYHAKAI
jgi:Putative lumazine-binding